MERKIFYRDDHSLRIERTNGNVLLESWCGWKKREWSWGGEGGTSRATAQLARVFVVNNLVEKARITEKYVSRFFASDFLGWPWYVSYEKERKRKMVDGKSRLSFLTIQIPAPPPLSLSLFAYAYAHARAQARIYAYLHIACKFFGIFHSFDW